MPDFLKPIPSFGYIAEVRLPHQLVSLLLWTLNIFQCDFSEQCCKSYNICPWNTAGFEPNRNWKIYKSFLELHPFSFSLLKKNNLIDILFNHFSYHLRQKSCYLGFGNLAIWNQHKTDAVSQEQYTGDKYNNILLPLNPLPLNPLRSILRLYTCIFREEFKPIPSRLNHNNWIQFPVDQQ